jgi:hypothetical protein
MKRTSAPTCHVCFHRSNTHLVQVVRGRLAYASRAADDMAAFAFTASKFKADVRGVLVASRVTTAPWPCLFSPFQNPSRPRRPWSPRLLIEGGGRHRRLIKTENLPSSSSSAQNLLREKKIYLFPIIDLHISPAPLPKARVNPERPKSCIYLAS